MRKVETMKTNVNRLIIAAGLMVALCGAAFGTMEVEQPISYSIGWNLVYVKVAPNVSADELFKNWPVEAVSLYDPAAFLDTKQYSAEDSTEGTTRNVMRTWRRGNPGASGFVSVPADSILMFKASAAGVCKIVGIPSAPRITWHPTSAVLPRNYIGISTWADVALTDYFSGSGILASDCALICGNGDIPQQAAIFNGQLLSDGMALAINTARPSDWSGVLNVSPRNGLDFGTEGTKAAIEVRNDGEGARLVLVRMVSGKIPTLETGCLYARDALTAQTNDAWTAFSVETPLEKTLASGETWNLQFALDRLKFKSLSGTVHGAVIDILDISEGGSKMRVTLPIQATSDGGASSEYAWPKGVWLASAELDKVSFFLTQEGDSTGKEDDIGMKQAGGKMKVRLPLYVDEKGAVTLLQRFWYGRNTNGVLRAYSGAVTESDEPLYDVKRVSSASLPADQPVVATAPEESFGGMAQFDFTVGEWSNVNPMRHAPHPRHDGLTADYLGETPSGDNFTNYVRTVKPEAFSVVNRIKLIWDENKATSWSPEETLTGTIKWDFSGIRHEGPIKTEGRFVMKRLSPVTMKMR